MARAIRKATKAAVSPVDGVAKEAEALAKSRFSLDIDGREYVTVVDSRYAVDVAKMYATKLLEN